VAGVAILIVLIFMGTVYAMREKQVFKAGTPVFMEMMLLGGMLGLCSIFAYADESDAGCRAFPFTLGLGYVLMFGALYLKTWRLMVIFRQQRMKMFKITLTEMCSYLALLMLVEFGFNAAWVGANPPELRTVQGSPPPLTYQECGGTNFNIWQISSFAYKGLFLFYGIFLAFMTRNLPTGYNESTWIGMSIYNMFFSVIVVLPVVYGGKTQDNQTAVFVIVCVAIIWVVLATCLALVVPKILLTLHPPAGGLEYAQGSAGGVYQLRQPGDKGSKHSDEDTTLEEGASLLLLQVGQSSEVHRHSGSSMPMTSITKSSTTDKSTTTTTHTRAAVSSPTGGDTSAVAVAGGAPPAHTAGNGAAGNGAAHHHGHTVTISESASTNTNNGSVNAAPQQPLTSKLQAVSEGRARDGSTESDGGEMGGPAGYGKVNTAET